jgi:asparagine synthase (glutamine-hydrolysing)
MSRWLAGTFDARGGDSSRLSFALDPDPANILILGDLNLAYTGPATESTRPLCLIDGFLDNASELREELGEIDGLNSAEQLLSAAYKRWGVELLPRLRGDFALLIWDQLREQGLLARDQLGVRSLFLHETSGRLCFATEMRQLLGLLPSSPRPDPVGVAHWVTTTGRPGTGTLYEGVRRLNPGSVLVFDRSGVREESYWSLRFVEPLRNPDATVANALKEALSRAVSRRLSLQGPTGVLMSGGLDSSSVAATAAKLAPGEVRAYSAQFPDHPAVDESALISQLRATLRLPGTSATVRAGGLLANALEWIDTWKAPLTSWGEFWCRPLLESAAAEEVSNVLGGDGGDELFGCRAYLMADRIRAGHPYQAALLARELPGAGDRPSRKALINEVRQFGLIGSIPARLHRLLSERGGGHPPSWLRPRVSKELAESLDPLAWKRLDGPRWWAHDAWALTRGVEQLGLFENHRRRTAACGLDGRHPIFDLDLLELAMRQPPQSTFDRFHDRPLLRRSMEELLPDTVRLRRGKARFDSLLMDSLSGSDRAAILGLLSSSRTELAAYVDLGELKHTLLEERPEPGVASFHWSYQLWRLLTAECWLRGQADTGGMEALATEVRASKARIQLQRAKGF